MAVSFDCGSYNLVCSRRGENGEIKTRREINCFVDMIIDPENKFMLNMLKDKKVKIIEIDRVAYVVGQHAMNLAYALPSINLKRPMREGRLNPSEKEAYRILKIIIHSLLGEVEKDKTLVYYSVPANATNRETNVDFHQGVLDSIFKSYLVNGKTVDAHPLNEALALVFAELADKNYTGIGVSAGAGMLNLCYAVMTIPVFKMSLVDSGDWIDEQAAKACGETPAVINKEKTKIDLLKAPTSMVERAIQGQYRILIQKTFSQIKAAIIQAGNKVRTEQPLDIVLAGGTSSPNGFVEMAKEVINEIGLGVPIGEIKRPKDHLYAVARGCLIAAENAYV